MEITDEELGRFVRECIDERKGISFGREHMYDPPGTQTEQRSVFEVDVGYPFDEYGPGGTGDTLQEAIVEAMKRRLEEPA